MSSNTKILNCIQYLFINFSTDSGGYIFRGHSSVVTDVLFSKDNNLIFSVSRDLTMRAWKANDYSCATVYR